MTVLRYLTNRTRRFKTFVANRVAVIHQNSDVKQWRYVPTKDNPADDGSRGITAANLLYKSTWLHGPTFLKGKPTEWPTTPPIIPLEENDESVRREPKCGAAISSGNFIETLANRCSSFEKLKAVVRLVIKATIKMRRRESEDMSEDSVEGVIFKLIQAESFRTEFHLLKTTCALY